MGASHHREVFTKHCDVFTNAHYFQCVILSTIIQILINAWASNVHQALIIKSLGTHGGYSPDLSNKKEWHSEIIDIY